MRGARIKEIAGSLTDLDGRYGFLVGPGSYRVAAAKTHYALPSKKLFGRAQDALYQNLYFGDPIIVSTSGDVITKNIPLDQEGFDWNEFAKRKKQLTLFYSKRDVFLTRLSGFLFYLGLTMSLMATIASPFAYNISITGLYSVIFLFRLFGFKPKSVGSITDRRTGEALSFAQVRVMLSGTDTLVTRRVSDSRGRYYCLVPPGQYSLSIDRKDGEESYTTLYTSPPLSAKGGIINRSFEV